MTPRCPTRTPPLPQASVSFDCGTSKYSEPESHALSSSSTVEESLPDESKSDMLEVSLQDTCTHQSPGRSEIWEVMVPAVISALFSILCLGSHTTGIFRDASVYASMRSKESGLCTLAEPKPCCVLFFRQQAWRCQEIHKPTGFRGQVFVWTHMPRSCAKAAIQQCSPRGEGLPSALVRRVG